MSINLYLLQHIVSKIQVKEMITREKNIYCIGIVFDNDRIDTDIL